MINLVFKRMLLVEFMFLGTLSAFEVGLMVGLAA